MLENSVFHSSPKVLRAFSGKTARRAKEAAAVMKLTAADLYERYHRAGDPGTGKLTPESGAWQVTNQHR